MNKQTIFQRIKNKQEARIHSILTSRKENWLTFLKKYNDSLGHLEGDEALKTVALCLKNQLKRETDFVARFGGEEFVCLPLPQERNIKIYYNQRRNSKHSTR